MKKVILKIKIFLTNIFRIIYSFLFINVGSLFLKFTRANAVTLEEMQTEATCYFTGPTEPTLEEKIVEQLQVDPSKVFILLVPVVLVVLFVIYIRVKNKKDKEDDNKEEK